MSANIRYIFFDLDDTLLDHKRAEKQSLLACQREFDPLHRVDPDHLVQTYRTINAGLWDQYSSGAIDRATLSRLRFEQTLTHLDVEPADAEGFRQVYMAKYRRYWEWIPGAKMTWEKVRSEWPVGIITNGFSETQKEKFQRFGFDHTAHRLVISEDVGVMKPHPHIFNYAAESAGVAPEQILYVGDSPHTDIVGAAASGFKTAWYKPHPHPDQERIPADFVFEGFDQFDAWLGFA